MDINTLSLKQLKNLANSIAAELRAREEAATKFRAEARLVPVKVASSYAEDGVYVAQSTQKRFAGGFFTEKLKGGRTKGLYAKTKTGVIYKRKNISGEWLKFDGRY
jgi:hypothetical protein